MLTITPSAQKHILDVLDRESKKYLRISIKGGGCSGFQYRFGFVESIDPDDTVIPVLDSQAIVVDALSKSYLQGSTLDYERSVLASQLVIINPNVTTSCGCGSSFSVS